MFLDVRLPTVLSVRLPARTCFDGCGGRYQSQRPRVSAISRLNIASRLSSGMNVAFARLDLYHVTYEYQLASAVEIRRAHDALPALAVTCIEPQ